jgi:chemotaxis protein CheY-P-specific phosphatase CheC
LLEDLGNIFTGSAKKRLEHLIIKTLIVKLARIKMVKIKNLGLTKTVNLPDKNIENLRDVIS